VKPRRTWLAVTHYLRSLRSALPFGWHTSRHTVHSSGQVKADDFVLITAASSSVWILSDSNSRQAEAVVILNHSQQYQSKCCLIKGADHVIVTNDEDFSQSCHGDYEGHGIDLILIRLRIISGKAAAAA